MSSRLLLSDVQARPSYRKRLSGEKKKKKGNGDKLEAENPEARSQGLPQGPKCAMPVTGTFLGQRKGGWSLFGGRLNAYGKRVSSTGQESNK